jgi:hypothetical protein
MLVWAEKRSAIRRRAKGQAVIGVVCRRVLPRNESGMRCAFPPDAAGMSP